MADPKVQPKTADNAADSKVHPKTADNAAPLPKHSGQHPPPPKPGPPQATYVVQLPKEQILRYPPPGNAKKFEALTRRKNRPSCCRRCCCFIFFLLVFLVIASAVSAGVLYFVFRFKSPKYTVTSLEIKGMNLTSAARIAPEFDVAIRAENPNSKVGIYYQKGGAISVVYNDLTLSDGVLPVFFQPAQNVTVLQLALTGSDVILGRAVTTSLRNANIEARIPFVVRTKAPVKIKVGSVKTWEITVKVRCDVVVDRLNARAKLVSHDCDYSVRLW
jgi:hypothetical protein